MKLLPDSLTATAFSMGNVRHTAVEEFLTPDALVIVIQDIARHAAALLPIEWNALPDYRVEAEALPAIHCKAERAYIPQPMTLPSALIDVLA